MKQVYTYYISKPGRAHTFNPHEAVEHYTPVSVYTYTYMYMYMYKLFIAWKTRKKQGTDIIYT